MSSHCVTETWRTARSNARFGKFHRPTSEFDGPFRRPKKRPWRVRFHDIVGTCPATWLAPHAEVRDVAAELVIVSVKVEGRSKSEVARDYKISRYWVQQLVRRYEAEGEAAFLPRSARPHTNPRRSAWSSRTRSSRCARSSQAGPGRRRGDHRAPTWRAHRGRASSAVGLDDLAGPDPSRVRHPPTPESDPKVAWHPVRRRPTQRTLAGRHHPLAAGRRHRRGDPQHHRRPLPPRPRLPGPGDHHRPRRARQLPSRVPPPRIPRQRAHRQRRHLHRHTPPRRPRRPRDRARPPRHPVPPLPALPPPDLRQGRAFPPDPEEMARRPTTRHHPHATCNASSTASAATTTPSDPTAPSTAAPPQQAYDARPKATARQALDRPPTTASATTRSTPAAVITLRYDSRLRHIGLGRQHRRPTASLAPHRRPLHPRRRRATPANSSANSPSTPPRTTSPSADHQDHPRNSPEMQRCPETPVNGVSRHHRSAPGRIRTCAPASGGRCSIP